MMSKKPLEYQIHLSQIAGISLAILIALGISLYHDLAGRQALLDQNIRNVGLLLSQSSEVRKLLHSDPPYVLFGQELDAVVKQMDYIDVVTICNTDSIRYYHNDKANIGTPFSGGDEGPILNGAPPYVTQAKGSLGMQRRAFYPVLDTDGTIIGFVMAAVLTSSISKLEQDILRSFLLAAVVLIGIGVLLSHLLYLRLKKILLGYGPEDLRRIYIAEKEVLDTLEEGMIAVDREGRLTLINQSARRILGTDQIPAPGTRLTQIYPETKLPKIIRTATPIHNDDLKIHENNILADHIPIIKQGKAIGAISIFRDKTEVTHLAEQLTGTRYMVDALRAFNHEFKNKLHVILGYIETGEIQKVRELILNNSMISSDAVSLVTQKIPLPQLAALLIGKLIRANALGIHLCLQSDCTCTEGQMHLPPDIYVTILGNLLENGIEALDRQDLLVKEIHVGIYIQATGSILSVDDTGAGIPAQILDHIFEQGISTKGEGRGSGMYLIKSLVDRYHGEIEIETEEQVGTSITITFSGGGAQCIE